ncbi:hypothetical protein HDU76_004116, partial [Blyttiomyces sp. JEL0837]
KRVKMTLLNVNGKKILTGCAQFVRLKLKMLKLRMNQKSRLGMRLWLLNRLILDLMMEGLMMT